MPHAAKHQCSWPGGCRLLVSGKFCSEHEPKVGAGDRHRWDTDRRPTERVRGRKLQRLRAALFAREPLCRACVVKGRTTLATIRDHVVPLAEGGTDDASNEQPLCQECSDLKTFEESKRGRMREAAAR